MCILSHVLTLWKDPISLYFGGTAIQSFTFYVFRPGNEASMEGSHSLAKPHGCGFGDIVIPNLAWVGFRICVIRFCGYGV